MLGCKYTFMCSTGFTFDIDLESGFTYDVETIYSVCCLSDSCFNAILVKYHRYVVSNRVIHSLID